MKQRILFFALCIGCVVYSQTAPKISAYHQITRSDKPDSIKVKEVDALLQLYIKEQKSDSIEYSASRYSNWLNLLKNNDYTYKAALVYDLVLANNSRSEIVLQKRYFKSGGLYRKAEHFRKSIQLYHEVIAFDPSNDISANAYAEIARNYYSLGDYQLSLEFYQEAEQRLVKLKNTDDLLRTYINSYNTLSRIGTPQARKKLYQNILAADTILSMPETNIELAYKMNRVAGLYFSETETRNTALGTQYLERALRIAQGLNAPIETAETYQNLGVLYAQENPLKAVAYNKKGLEFLTEEFKEQQAILHANMGRSYAFLEEYEVAIGFLGKAINTMTGENLNTLSSKEKSKVLVSKFAHDNLWVVIDVLAQTYLKKYEISQDLNDLDKAIEYFKYLDLMLDERQFVSNQSTSKLLWRRKAISIYSIAIKACYLKNDVASAFHFMEKSKALVLLEEIRLRNLQRQVDVPEEHLLRLNILKEQIASLKNVKNGKINTAQLLAVKSQLTALNDSLKVIYPAYNALSSFENNIATVEDVQRQLSDSELLVEYHMSSDTGNGVATSHNVGYSIIIGKKGVHFFKINDLDELKQMTELTKEKLMKPFRLKTEISAYHDISHRLYKRLFPNLKLRALLKGKDITFISDSFLSQIPMEALVVNPPGEPLTYLIENAVCHYSNSYTFDTTRLMRQKSKPATFLAMAPIDFKNTQLGTLYNSKDEVLGLEKVFKGKVLLESNATKEAFVSTQNAYSILHLATHANALDVAMPWIAFSDEKLILDEIYLMENNADLVVLSACNTSTGVYASGEGVLSLSRGFFFGGAQSVVSSLWKVDDVATSELMKSFYKQLDQGENKSQALHKAKLDFLTTHSGREASPYFWSTFILTGNTTALDLDRQASVWWFVPAGMVIIFLLLMMKKRSMQKDPISN